MLGIFQGKEKKNHGLILKSLVFGQKGTRQIAEYVYRHRGNIPLRPEDMNKNRLKNIESIISKKGSRLDELKVHGYICQNGSLWELTPKGMGVALTLFPSVSDILPYLASYILSTANQYQKMIQENPTIVPLLNRRERRQGDRALQELRRHLTSESFFQFFKDFTGELIVQGLDLDKVSDKDFTSMLYGKWFTSNLPKLAGASIGRGGLIYE